MIKNYWPAASGVGQRQKPRKVSRSFKAWPAYFFIALFIVPGLDFRFHWSDVPPAISWVADGFVALGFYIVFLVFRENSYTSAAIEVSSEQKVISSGPYGVVRHPMYAGAFLLLLFTPLALGSWVAIPLPIPVILVIIVRLLAEEKFLSANLSGYEAYCQKVRYRLLPFVW
jgi:protein-S-isoprenylcysteine O-methyltransferase Ste14